jgi:UDP-N-acetylglucosamine/UDP-N-acetylgalactosamine diphosphorylase
MNHSQAKDLLAKAKQEHVLKFWNELDKKARADLLAQIDKIDFGDLAYCAKSLKATSQDFDISKGKAPKVAVLEKKKLAAARTTGEEAIRAGKVAALLVAGGQGSRLGFEGPKGCYPVGPISGASLFYFHARKILARSIRYNTTIPFYIMTSEANNEDTVRCFEENSYFGLNPEDVFFFTQGMWPGMDKDGKIIMAEKGRIFMSPDGHGGLLAALKRSGALADMKKRGIESVFFFQVDNPLVEIADPAFIGHHILSESEYSLKLSAKRDPFEKVGIPMRFGDKYKMVEYTEMTPEQCQRKDAKGNLYFLYGSPAIHVFDRKFLEREASRRMPLHLAFKKIPYVNENGETVKPSDPNGYKFEKFIFDILPNAKKTAFLAFDPKEEFSPVKNAEGSDSPKTCMDDMQAKWRRWFTECGINIPEGVPVEVDPVYALDAEDIKSTGIILGAE